MTAHTASDTVGANVRRIRKARGLSVAELAERCAERAGDGPRLSASVIENIEHGRRKNGERTRDVTVDEVMALAAALSVGPGVLLPTLLAGGVVYPEDEATAIADVLLGNADVMRDLAERVRGGAIPAAAALTVTAGLSASATVTPGATLRGESGLTAG